MASTGTANGVAGDNAVLMEILSTVKKLQQDHVQLAATVETLKNRLEPSLTSHPLPSLTQNRPTPSKGSPSLDPVLVARAADGLSSTPPSSLGPASLAIKASPTILPQRKS